jgi:hypothetical protein
MNSAGNANAPTTGTTSSSAPANTSNSKTPAELTEAQFLQQQAELAKEAISRTLKRIATDLGKGASPIEWAREYPWVSLGAATVAGFFAANMLIPSKEDQALKKLARLERAINPPPPPVFDTATTDKDPAKHGFFYGLMNQALKAIQPAIISAITAHVAKNEPTNGQAQAAGSGNPPSTGAPPSV